MRRRVILAAALLTCALVVPGCGSQAQPEQSVGEVEREEGIVGGWALSSAQVTSLLSEDEAAIIVPALNNGQMDDLGWTYSPVSVLARSLDEDGNPERVGVLCQARVGDEVGWYVVTIDFADSGENGEPMKYVADIDPSDLKTTDTWEGVFSDEGWEVAGTTGEASLEAEAQEAFDLVRPELQAAGEIRVHACIASQLVAGMNYLYIVETKPLDGIEERFSFVVVYRDLEGNASVTENSYVDLMAYLAW